MIFAFLPYLHRVRAGMWATRRALLNVVAAGILAGLSPPGVVRAAEVVTHEHLGLEMLGRLELAPGTSLEREGVALILHGTLAYNGMEIIRELQANLRQRGVTTLAVTLTLGLDRRTGMFDCGLEHDHRHGDAVEELGAWLDWLRQRGVGRIDLIGHSRGGTQIALLAAEEPERIAGRLVLAGPLLDDRADPATASRYAAQFGAALGPMLGMALQREESGEPDTLIEAPGFLHCRGARVTSGAFLDYYAGTRPALPALLRKVAVPTLVIAAGADEIEPNLPQALARAGLPAHVRTTLIDGSDHFFRDLHGEDLADVIAAFLRAK